MKIQLTLVALLTSMFVSAQVEVISPIASEVSHPDLHIQKITFYTDSTVFDMLVENKRTSGGWFCADKNMYIENPTTRQRARLLKSVGIVNCPNAYNFKSIGETLQFRLIFSPLQYSRTINLVEDCKQSCFYFKNIILDQKLNNDIRTYEKAMEFYTQNEFAKAIDEFVKVVEIIPAYPTHVYGYSYYHLVTIYRHLGDMTSANFWEEQLQMSPLPDKQYFIDELKKVQSIEKK